MTTTILGGRTICLIEQMFRNQTLLAFDTEANDYKVVMINVSFQYFLDEV